MKEKIEQLYAQEMTRYDFLRYVAIVSLSIIGVTGLMRAILHTNLPGLGASVRHGYGSSPYGGATSFNK